MVRFREPISGYEVTLPSYQWGYADGIEYLERMVGTTPHGVVVRQKHWDPNQMPYTQRLLRVLFEQDEATIQALRTLAWFAMKNSGPVQFFPDASTLDYWWVDWMTITEVERVIDNHLTLELTLVENIVPPPPPAYAHISQYAIEVMLYLGEQAHISQQVVEVAVYPDAHDARISQQTVEVMVFPDAHPASLSQLVVEVMAQFTAVKQAHLSQLAVEVMVQAPLGSALFVTAVDQVVTTDAPTAGAYVTGYAWVSQVPVEAVIRVPTDIVQVAQVPVEAVVRAAKDVVQVAQVPVEAVIRGADDVVRVSQVPVEAVIRASDVVRVSQIVVEVIVLP